MRAVDTSSIVHAWDTYPPDIFDPLWDWMGELVRAGELAVPSVALEEVSTVSPPCRDWLDKHNVSEIEVDNDTLQTAQEIKNSIGVVNDDYYQTGVGENDVIIVATAKCHSVPLITNEKVQIQLPTDMRRYKIPAVCNLPTVAVPCGSYLDFLNEQKPRLR